MHLHKACLEQLGVVADGRIHTSRLKLKLLSIFPHLKSTIYRVETYCSHLMMILVVL